MNVFEKRLAFKPYEYPEVIEFKKAINHSYWLVSEFNFSSDIQDFAVKLDEKERHVLKNAMLAISQIEVSVKKFWANLGLHFPKAELEQVGITFAESEVRHADAYSHLLEVLGLNDEFDQLLQIPVISNRVDYLQKYLKGASDTNHENFLLTLTLFSIFIENVSLFSQFLIIRSFFQQRAILKTIDNVVQATQKEELIHALFGVKLIEIVKRENPDWFGEDFYKKIYRACKKAYEAECKIVEWIFEKGDLEFISKDAVIEFLKCRFNESLRMVGAENLWEEDNTLVKQFEWFNIEILGEVNSDFFFKNPVTYSKMTKSIGPEDLF